MADLSHAALTVWDKFCGIVEDHGSPRLGLATALRAVADQVVPHEYLPYLPEDDAAAEARQRTRFCLLAIAAELEGGSD